MATLFPASVQREEFANSAVHALGCVASAVGGGLLINRAAVVGDGWQLVSAIIYTLSLVLLYGASACYHATPFGPTRAWLERADHSAIYLLIAGTYTPFLLVSLRDARGWTLLGVIWGLAVVGILLKLRWIGRFPRLSTATYLGMGWLVLAVAQPLVQVLSLTTIVQLILGGLFYSLGTFFYHNERMPFAHTVWHLFVICGSVCHFLAVASQVAPS